MHGEHSRIFHTIDIPAVLYCVFLLPGDNRHCEWGNIEYYRPRVLLRIINLKFNLIGRLITSLYIPKRTTGIQFIKNFNKLTQLIETKYIIIYLYIQQLSSLLRKLQIALII